MLHITIAQLNLTVGDIEGNVARMVAAEQIAEVVLFVILVLLEF